MEIVVQAILDWLSKHLPPILAAFGIGYKLGQEGEAAAKKELFKKELELEKEKNINKVHQEFDGKSDADIILGAASSGPGPTDDQS